MTQPALIHADDLRGAHGEGVSIAVIDSGIHAAHPHIDRPVAGIAIDVAGNCQDDFTDRLGHGTAVAAAILDTAPAVSLVAVKVFDRTLATSANALVRAIEWAAERRVRLVNLSLGTSNRAHAGRLREAIGAACRAGSIVVSALESDGVAWYPGSLDGVVPVRLDGSCPRAAVILDNADGRPVLRASGYPRPIPGVPPEHNLRGISFAVANATALLACALTARPLVSTAAEAVGTLAEAVRTAR